MTSPHGTPKRYTYGPDETGTPRKGCRCRPCRDAIAAESRRVRRLKAYGQWEPFTDAAPVRQHILSLGGLGIGWPQVAILAGVPPSTVSGILFDKGRPRAAQVRTGTARRILAVRGDPDDLAPGALTDSTGTRRRLQALISAGHTPARIAAALGADRTHVGKVTRGTSAKVTAATARAVRDLYDKWWDQGPPEWTPRERAAARRARDHARRLGWIPAAGWDDDPGPHWIDAREARPAPGSRRREAGAG